MGEGVSEEGMDPISLAMLLGRKEILVALLASAGKDAVLKAGVVVHGQKVPLLRIMLTEWKRWMAVSLRLPQILYSIPMADAADPDAVSTLVVSRNHTLGLS